MLFVVLALFSMFLYIRGYKISALVIFFFFVTGGFNLIPDEIVDLGTPLTKNSDYAFFILLGFCTIELIFHTKKFLKIDMFAIYLIVFFAFLFVCILYNKYYLGIGWGEIIRTVRYLFFWLAYFILRNMKEEQLRYLLNCLFVVTVFISVVYIMQIVLGKNILVEMATSTASFLGMKVPRFYNQPAMLHFFVFLSIYNNPCKGVLKYVTIIILITALFGAFHRSLIGAFFVAVSVGFFLKLPNLRQIQFLTVSAFLLIFFVLFFGNRFTKSRTFIDIKTVMTENMEDIEIDFHDLKNATFSFRIAHLVERNEYIRQSPLNMLFGAGLLTEDSKMVDKLFDFKVGVVEELTSETTQLDTGDISYSFLLIRYGYVGTILSLSLFLYMLYYFYKNRDNKYGFLSLLYLIMILCVSFFSSNLIIPSIFLLPMISMLIIRKTKEEYG